MSRQTLIVLVIILSIFNGIFSPWVFVAVGFAPAWMPGFLPFEPQTLFYCASLLISTLTLLVSGVPAALAERVLKRELSPEGSIWIWIAAAALLCIPGIEALIAQL